MQPPPPPPTRPPLLQPHLQVASLIARLAGGASARPRIPPLPTRHVVSSLSLGDRRPTAKDASRFLSQECATQVTRHNSWQQRATPPQSSGVLWAAAQFHGGQLASGLGLAAAKGHAPGMPPQLHYPSWIRLASLHYIRPQSPSCTACPRPLSVPLVLKLICTHTHIKLADWRLSLGQPEGFTPQNQRSRVLPQAVPLCSAVFRAQHAVAGESEAKS